ncbi:MULTISPECIES: hypothetical protein [Solibacillus]|uniref:LysM domain-containing protein n=1 Tax=Solibacillus merdavium TaxID=2762218 RepID=A0ABR8XRB0_9BACL|nr:hypothetical protein [Solibacillus merdavium]MBD8034483.1 hypothetical protein [Solibacillus merdavium]
MRFLIASIVLLLIAFVIKVDLQEGTLPLTSFYASTQSCDEILQESYVVVKIQQDDTIYSLFSATPSPVKTTFPERLAQFYKLNPHLNLQPLVPGDTVFVPIISHAKENCTK